MSMARRPGISDDHKPAILRLAGKGAFAGAVLDADAGQARTPFTLPLLGCTFWESMWLRPHCRSREKAAALGLDADFVVADALHLDRLGRVFDTVLDCGLFHTFDSDERGDYVASLASVTSRGGNLYVLCFSDVGPADTCGPHPISQEGLKAAFKRSREWSVTSVSPERLQTRFNAQGAPFWLAKIKRM
jgi:hypothetical protein